MEVKVKKLKPEAKLPTYAHPGDVGMDLYAAEATTIPAHGRGVVPTGLAVAIPDGYVGLIWNKSSVSLKLGIMMMTVFIYAIYRGVTFLAMNNTTNEDYTFEVGQKAAQILIQPIVRVLITETVELDETSRGTGGFGSTGK